jgi:predicted RND superfamily exporter protein
MAKYPNIAVHTFGRSFYYRVFYRQLVIDVLWAGLAAFVVYVYVIFHVKSLFVSTFAMAQILFSFPITLVIYKVFMRITNISPLHLMVVFLVLGISADNIFVIWDAWQQSDTYPEFSGNQKKRMAYTFRRASKAIMATSSTTAFAFLSNGFSSLMPVSAFGYFAFVIVPVNYVLIVFYFPAFLIVYENIVKEKEAIAANFVKIICCCEGRSKLAQVKIETINGPSETER